MDHESISRDAVVQQIRSLNTGIYTVVGSSWRSRLLARHKAHDVGNITCRYNVRVIYAAWRRAALNGSSDVRLGYTCRPAVTSVEIRDL